MADQLADFMMKGNKIENTSKGAQQFEKAAKLGSVPRGSRWRSIHKMASAIVRTRESMPGASAAQIEIKPGEEGSQTIKINPKKIGDVDNPKEAP